MDKYIDITLMPDPEFETQQLMNALFSKLHRAIGEAAPGEIGVSFPKAGKRLGDQLRLHGTQESLAALMAMPWLQGMRDYCQVSDCKSVPDNVQYRTVRRIQAKSAHNKRKRSIRKGWLTEEEALERIPEEQQKVLKQPFIQMRSLSNGNPMRVYVEHGPVRDEPVTGEFNSYGLSAQATIPWF
ncbi:MAG: type I-F CRISPR-associated endoribonuclease Cas6/Csy4 [Oceanospirillaceae bacterium]|nr:type I-F CRISPR-associated endoribonuclease Cas6/Csy4 [Oceanospirillaceae bacterium]|tara:strand:+ start:9301 stop:9852 length:552 start_codon:yes stop_codon:yes gene_type:complete